MIDEAAIRETLRRYPEEISKEQLCRHNGVIPCRNNGQAMEGHPLELPIKLGAFYGLRRSEILGLKWNAIDFTANTITIRHTVTSCNVDGKHIEVAADTTKTKSSMRTLPLVPDFRDLLLRKKEEQAHYRRLCGRSYCTDYLDYVCVNELGERLKPNTLSSGFKRILETNGMRIIRLHDLRHSCASLLLANGVPMKQIQEWLGHSDFSTTANIYAHLDYHSKLSSADAMLNGLGMTSHHNDLSLPAHEKKPCNPCIYGHTELFHRLQLTDRSAMISSKAI